MKKKIILVIIILLVLISIFTCYKIYTKDNSNNDDVSSNNIDDNIDWNNYETRNINLTKSVTIKEEGIYNLTGSIDSGKITINSKGNVKLILNNINISNDNGPAILVENANIVVISLEDDSTNTLKCGTNDEYKGCIYSKDNLVVENEGILNINSSLDGISSNDNIKINSGNININAEDDGIKGKDSVYINGGNITINSNGDAIKSTNDNDSSKGNIKIIDGVFNIKTGSGSTNSSDKSTWGSWGNDNTTSSKGIKAVNNITIESGTFNLDTSDDSIHSNNNINIKNGNFKITSGDDGIHADNKLSISSGTINIDKSYEGLESTNIIINDGDINIISSDDGINAAGGNDSSANNRKGNPNEIASTGTLTINGGNISIDSSGDGLDANGNIYINGGNINVEGPENDGNGAIDYDKELVFTKGNLFASGSSGMAQGISSNSTSYGILINFDTTYSVGTNIILLDSNDNEIFNYTTKKKISSITYASDKLTKDEYKILVNNVEYKSFTITNISTTIGNSGFMGNNMPNNR